MSWSIMDGLIPEDAFELPPMHTPGGYTHTTTPAPLRWPLDPIISTASPDYTPPDYPHGMPAAGHPEEKEYVTDYGTHGEAYLCKRTVTTKHIATFDTMRDAQVAAKALNEAQGL